MGLAGNNSSNEGASCTFCILSTIVPVVGNIASLIRVKNPGGCGSCVAIPVTASGPCPPDNLL